MNNLGKYISDSYSFMVDYRCDILGYHIVLDHDKYIDVWIDEPRFLHYIESKQIRKIELFEPISKLPKFSF